LSLPIFLLQLFQIDELQYLAGFWVIAMLLLGLIVFIDFLSMGSIKRIKDPTVAKIYFPLYIFFSTITLSFLYRPIIYNFVDHKYTKRLFLLSIPYCLILILHKEVFTNNLKPHFPTQTVLVQEGYAVNDIYYEDLYFERLKYLSEQEIHDDRVKGKNIRLGKFYNDKDHIKVFVKMLNTDHDLLKEKYGLNPFFKQGFNFSLFSDDEFNDTLKVKHISEDKTYSSLKDSIRAKRRALRNGSIDSLQQVYLNQEIDQLRSKRDSIVAVYESLQKDYNREQPQEILNAYKEIVQFELNEQMVDSLTNYFHVHPFNKEKGILFYLPVDSLVVNGFNSISIERKVYNEFSDNSLKTQIFKLPFHQSKK
jgi:hypothetical protein